MTITGSKYRSLLAILAGVLALSAPAGVCAQDGGNLNPGILPPDSKPLGLSYGQWSARWWQWVLSMPADANPLTDTAACSAGQSGQVWFLGGTFTATPPDPDVPEVVIGKAERECIVPSGTFLFFPILNAEASTAEGNGETADELRAVAEFLMDHAVDLEATIDGTPVQALDRYRAQSPGFTYGPLPENNLFALPEGTTSLAVSDGFFLMLAPLPVGEHTIHFSGAAAFTEEEDGFDFFFGLDITYHITVVPRGL